KYAAAVYAFNDGTNTSELCSGPLRQCGNGNLFGGDEPAMTWFSAMNPISDIYGPVGLPEPDPAYQRGTGGSGPPEGEGRRPAGGAARGRPPPTRGAPGDPAHRTWRG